MREEINRRKCPNCGKVFTLTCRDYEWGYAYDAQLVCSYTCMRQMERLDKLKPKGKAQIYSTPGASFLRNHLRGESYEQIASTATAQYMRLTDAAAVKRFVYHWQQHHPEEAQQIKQEVELESIGVTRKDLVKRCAARSQTVANYAARLGITGKRCGKQVIYTQEEAARIVDAFKVVTA